MDMHSSITTERVIRAVEEDEYIPCGFCIFCGERASGIEPDAEKYECECCGMPGVYGAEELLLYLA